MESNGDIVLNQSIFKIGTVLSVSGREVKVKVDKQKNLQHIFFRGTLVKNVSVGGYLKIINGFSSIVAKVDSEFISSDDIINNNYSSEEAKVYRVLVVSLLGYLTPDRFVKGIKQLPLIDNDCYLLSNEEFKKIHRFIDDELDKTITIGTLASDYYTPISLGIQKLFSSHIGIFGNTGSGKSYTLAKIYRELFKTYDGESRFRSNSKFLIIDFNGEYSGENVITPEKKVYDLSTRKDEKDINEENKITFSKDVLLDLDTLCIFASATEKTQRPFISRCIEYERYIKDVDHFKNILRKDIAAILCMADKPKSELLIDYLLQILPKKYDEITDEEIGLHSDFLFHESNHYYYKTGLENAYEGKFMDYPALVKETIIYNQVDKYLEPSNFLEKFIHIMYLRLIRDLLDNRAMNEHISPAINKLRSMVTIVR